MARRREPCVELLDLQRARDSVSLTDVASHLDETIHHLVVLDAFGDDPQAEIVTQIDGGCHDHVIVGFEGEQFRSEPVSFDGRWAMRSAGNSSSCHRSDRT